MEECTITQSNILLSVELIKRLEAEIEERQAQVEALKDGLKDAMKAKALAGLTSELTKSATPNTLRAASIARPSRMNTRTCTTATPLLQPPAGSRLSSSFYFEKGGDLLSALKNLEVGGILP